MIDHTRNHNEGEQERLEQSLADYRAISELAGVARVDLSTGKFLRVNPRMCDIVGYSEEELLAMTLLDLTHPEDRKQDWACFERMARGVSRAYEGEKRYVRKDGSVAWANVGAKVIRDATERPLHAIAVMRDVTQRERAEAALREREEQLRSVTDSAPVMILATDLEGNCTYVNRPWLDFTGQEPETGLDQGWLDAVHPEDRSYARNTFSEARARREASRLEYRLRRKDGAYRWVIVATAPRFGPDGACVGYTGSVIDITYRQEAEGHLHATLKELADLKFALDESTIVAFTDHRGRITHVNDKFCEVSKYSRDELIGQDHRIINSSYHPEEYIKGLWRTIARGRTWRGELRNRAKDGSIYWVDTTIVPFLNDRGKPYQYVAIRYEITDRKRVEEQLREGNTLLESVIEGTSDAIYLKDTQGRYLLANSRAAEVFGDPLKSIVGKSDEELLSPEEARRVAELNRTIIATGETQRFEEHRPVAGTDRTFLTSAAPYRDHQGEVTGVIGVASDITDLKRAEEALSEIREAERGRISRELHDVVLQDLTYALQTVRSHGAATGEIDEVAAALQRSVGGLRDAVRDLRQEETGGGSFVRSIEALVELNRRMSPGIEVELELDRDFPDELSERPGRDLVRVVQEALANARRHSEARRIRVAIGHSPEKLWVEVSDDGRGFDQAETPAGIGTNSMRERAREFGGNLEVTSVPGLGTKVRCEVLAYGQGKPARVLLVEDHAAFRQGVAATLEREPGFAVVGQAGSLAEARQMLDGFDVAIVDLGLPDGFGGDLIRDLRVANPSAQALVLSATYDRAEVARAVEAGAAGVLHKSADVAEVAVAVRRLRAGETLMPLQEVVELLRFAGARKDEEHEAQRAISRLTERELEVLSLLAEGLEAQEISTRLHISAKTERNHVARILAKLGVHSRLQALVFAARHGIVEIGRKDV